MKPTISASSSGGGMKSLEAALAKIQKAQVYVGIPEAETGRDESGVTNAGLMYIHTHGSPLQHIPPRPVIEPALAAPDNKENITQELSDAARSVLGEKAGEAKQHLRRAGMLGRNAAIRWFTDHRNGWPPDSPATVAAKGSDRPLIDTGQLRRSITYVVEE